MAHIDPARLARILSILSNKNERVTISPEYARPAPRTNQSPKSSRSTAVLRARLKTRLNDSQKYANYREIAPAIAIQEILCWEFGNQIIEHPDFERVITQITTTILHEAHMAQAMTVLIDEMSGTDH
jgi:hypothetical protein